MTIAHMPLTPSPHDYSNHRAADAPTHVLAHKGGPLIPISRAVLRQRGQINARAYEAAKARRQADA